jgi:hypothetical protein
VDLFAVVALEILDGAYHGRKILVASAIRFDVDDLNGVRRGSPDALLDHHSDPTLGLMEVLDLRLGSRTALLLLWFLGHLSQSLQVTLPAFYTKLGQKQLGCQVATVSQLPLFHEFQIAQAVLEHLGELWGLIPQQGKEHLPVLVIQVLEILKGHTYQVRKGRFSTLLGFIHPLVEDLKQSIVDTANRQGCVTQTFFESKDLRRPRMNLQIDHTPRKASTDFPLEIRANVESCQHLQDLMVRQFDMFGISHASCTRKST